MRSLSITLSAILAALVVTLGLVAWQIEVDYFEAYKLLLNAKTIAAGNGPYEIRRFIFPSLLSAPWFWLESHLSVAGLGFRASHLAAVVFFAIFLGVVYRLLRHSYSKEWALAGVAGFAFLPLVIHYVPTAKEDLLAALLVTLALLSFQEERWKLCGLFTGLAIVSRYNLIPILPLFFLAHRRKDAKALIGIPLLVFITLPTFLYPYLGRADAVSAIAVFLRELYAMLVHHGFAYQPPIVFAKFLVVAMGLPLLALALAGMARRSPLTLFHTSWVFLYLGYQTFVLSGKEARFLFPVIPSLIFLVLRGLEWMTPRRRAVAFTILAIYCGGRGGREVLKFRDPFYGNPFAKNVAERAKFLAGGNRVFWVGNYYGTRPQEYVFHPEERFAYLYHVYTHTIEFHSGQRVEDLSRRPWKEVGTFARSGDVFLINHDTRNNRTDDVTEAPPKLILQRARLQSARLGEGGKALGVEDGEYEWYGRASSNAPWKSLGVHSVRQGKVIPDAGFSRMREFKALDFDVVEAYDFTRPFSPSVDEPHIS